MAPKSKTLRQTGIKDLFAKVKGTPSETTTPAKTSPIKKETKEDIKIELKSTSPNKKRKRSPSPLPSPSKNIKPKKESMPTKIAKVAKTAAKSAAKTVKAAVPTAAKPAKDMVVPTFDPKLVSLALERGTKTGYYVGAHVSAANGIHNAIVNMIDIGGNACAFFVKSQRKWNEKPRPKQHVQVFKDTCKSIGFDQSKILVHGSYLINLAQKDQEKRDRALSAMVDELQRCRDLGITYYNFHPGSATDGDRPGGLKKVSEGMNYCLSKVPDVVMVVECMAGQGNVLGRTYQELKTILDGIDEDKKDRTGICLDTCHMFAGGYDIRSKDAFTKTLNEFDKVIGIDKLMGVHLNDSKNELDSRVDRHEHLGKGFIGKESFKFIMNEPRFKNIPMILETPEDNGNKGYRDEVTLLYDMHEEETKK